MSQVLRNLRALGYPEMGGLTVRDIGFRIATHNPEVLGSNPSPATDQNQSPSGSGFLLARRTSVAKITHLGGFGNEPMSFKLNAGQID